MIDISGKKFNRLKIISLNKINNHYQSYWNCICICGNKKIIRQDAIVSGNTKSCGCLHIEKAKERQFINCYKDGRSGNKIYIIWKGILKRCNNKKEISYPYYGGRGIKCLWKSFEEFYNDMGDVPRKNLSIDRIDNNGHYCKENCKWSTKSEQAYNRRTAHLITYNGKTQNMKKWAVEYKISNKVLWWRINKGWSVERALTT